MGHRLILPGADGCVLTAGLRGPVPTLFLGSPVSLLKQILYSTAESEKEGTIRSVYQNTKAAPCADSGFWHGAQMGVALARGMSCTLQRCADSGATGPNPLWADSGTIVEVELYISVTDCLFVTRRRWARLWHGR